MVEEIENAKQFNWDLFLEIRDSPESTETAGDVDPPPRIETKIYRISRDTKLAIYVKTIYNYECQICGTHIQINEKTRYAEAHHIRPLGGNHQGLDRVDNLLCLCPNCHIKLDYGVSQIDTEQLHKKSKHSIKQEYLEYHNNKVFKSR